MAPYAYICDTCHHLATSHGLVDGGDVRSGPYQCQLCSCSISQDDPVTGMTRSQYENWLGAPAKHVTPETQP